MPAPDRRALEDHWRKRLTDAELRLNFTRTYLKEVQQDYPPGEIQNADGHYAYRDALSAETEALREYRRVLQIFNDLIVHGKIPKEGS